jgi:tripartite-type tricarboxylate transporter receptor subunit TctC
MRFAKLPVMALAVGLAAFGATNAARADAAEDYFKGKTINIIVGYGPSGGYAVYCRQLTAFFGKYIPGKPNVICQFMPGQGGVKAASYLYKVASKDGAVLGMLSDYAAVAQLMQPKKIKYDIRGFKWVGVMVQSNPLLTVRKGARVQKPEDLFDKEMTIGVTGVLAQSGINAQLMNRFLGTKIKLIAGYKSTGKVALAMQQGEVDATMSSWISLKARTKNLFDTGQFIGLVQVGYQRAKDLPNVPLMSELAKTKQAKQVANLASASSPFGRSVSVMPGYPAHLLAALRKSFMATMADKEFLETAKKRNIDIDPSPGESLEPVLAELMATPASVVKLVQDAAGFNKKKK